MADFLFPNETSGFVWMELYFIYMYVFYFIYIQDLHVVYMFASLSFLSLVLITLMKTIRENIRPRPFCPRLRRDDADVIKR